MRALLAATAVAATAGVLVLAVLPPPALPARAATFSEAWPVARGAFHVHSNRSDGTGTLDEIATAAAAAGLQFVILTDHGNGTREPEPPAYRSGVLCIDAVEISTDDGHYVALGLGRTPYPLAGRARDVIEDVHRLGGFGVAAHPGSPKAGLQWTDWEAALDGLEWLNADSEWRDEFWGSLGVVLLTYAFRPTETLTGILDRPEAVLQHWDAITRRRRVAAVAGADAHARVGIRPGADPYEDRVLARLPGYETSFRAFANHVVLNASLTGRAAEDAAAVLEAVREGRVFTAIGGLAGLTAFDARATSGGAVARPGEYLDLQGDAVIEARIAAPPGTTLVVRRDGVVLYEIASDALRLDVGQQVGAYRIEARLPNARSGSGVPWLLTNPFYVGLRAAHAQATPPASPPETTARSGVATGAWRAEASADSTSALAAGSLEDGTPALHWRFALGGTGAMDGPYAAIRFPVSDGLAGHDGVQLRIQADRPRRLWLQIRAPGGTAGERWGTTLYVDETLRQVERRWEDFRPLGAASTSLPPLDRIDSLLLVVDTVNTAPGSDGASWIPDLWLVR